MASTHPPLPVSTPLEQVVEQEAPLSPPQLAVPEPANYLQEAVLERASSLQETASVEAASAEAATEEVAMEEAATAEATPEPVSCLQEVVKERANSFQEVKAYILRERVPPLLFSVPAVYTEQVAIKGLINPPLLPEVPSIP